MGKCDYCGERPAGHEIIDDDESNGVAMLCEVCYAGIGGCIVDMTDADCLRIVATLIAESDGGYRDVVEKHHTETAKKIIYFLAINGRN